ncbi:hypothetical protein S245_048588, partial [Arachis hypogaea]
CILEGKMHHLGAVLYHFKTDGEGGDSVADAGDGVETEGDGTVGEYCGEPMGAVPVPVGGCETGKVFGDYGHDDVEGRGSVHVWFFAEKTQQLLLFQRHHHFQGLWDASTAAIIISPHSPLTTA